MKIFKQRHTKWIPIFIYDYQGNKYLLMGRRNLKTGLANFTNVKINGSFNLMQVGLSNNLNPASQFDELFNPTP